jgi:hypothetical protein
MLSVCDWQEVVVKYVAINCPVVIIGETLPQHKIKYNYQGNKAATRPSEGSPSTSGFIIRNYLQENLFVYDLRFWWLWLGVLGCDAV